MDIIIRINTEKIENWSKIEGRHKEYIKKTVLTKLKIYNTIIFLCNENEKYNIIELEDSLKIINRKFYDYIIDKKEEYKTDVDKMLKLETVYLNEYENFINDIEVIKMIPNWDFFENSDSKKSINNKSTVHLDEHMIYRELETYKKIIYIVTGKEVINEKELRDNINKLTLGKKSEWEEFIRRYKKIKSENSFYDKINKSKCRIKSLINKLQETIPITKENKDLYEKLHGIVNEYNVDSNKRIDKELKKDIFNKLGFIDIDDIIKKIFDYDKFSSDKNEWNRHKILTMLNIEVCPYCNRQYVTSYSEEGKRRTTADLDHYHSQSKYPFLALSLYNFIPSCPICNRNFKKDNDKEIMYPYEESFDDDDVQYKFNTSIKDDVRYLIGEDKDFTLSINKRKDKYITNKLERANNSNEIFKLDKVYQSHKGYVEELFEKAYKYNEIWRSDINGIFKSEDSLFIDKKELFEFAFGKNLTPEEYSKRPLAKLTRDILDELGIEVK